LSLNGNVDHNASVSNDGTSTVTVSGLASDVNTVLASLSYAANSEFEGSDTLNGHNSADGSSMLTDHSWFSTHVNDNSKWCVIDVTSLAAGSGLAAAVASHSPSLPDSAAGTVKPDTNGTSPDANATNVNTVLASLSYGSDTLHVT